MLKYKPGRRVPSGVQDFCKNTTIHGLNIVGLPKLNIFERIFWIVIVVVAIGGAIALTISNWNRFQANPTVVSLQKDYRNWENYFPAATGCFNNRVNSEKAQDYINKTWRTTPSDVMYGYYMEFLQTVANATYQNLYRFSKFQDIKNLHNVDMVDLVTKVHPPLSGSLVTIDRKRKTDWHLILTELGLCFTFNSKFSKLLSPKNSSEFNRTSKKFNADILKCHFLNGICYARYESDPNLSLKYYVHSYLDVVHVDSKVSHELIKSEEMDINYKMIETDASPSIRYLSPTQRRCRFDDEPLTEDAPVYSTSFCHIMCRYRLALTLCGCKPFFYHFLAGKVCNISGLICLSKYIDKFTQGPSKLRCKCPQPCHLITYLPQNPKHNKWEEGMYFEQRIAFRWGLLHPTTKYRKDILFGFEDLIVSLGGTFNLFLGISFISIIEAIFLIIEIILRNIRKREKQKESKLFVIRQAAEVRRHGSDTRINVVNKQS